MCSFFVFFPLPSSSIDKHITDINEIILTDTVPIIVKNSPNEPSFINPPSQNNFINESDCVSDSMKIA